MSSKAKTMIELTLFYLIGFAIGVVVFFVFPDFHIVIRVLLGDIAMTLWIWMYGLIRKNSSVYDPYWSVVPPVILILVALYLDVEWTSSSILLICGVSIWATRLTYNWALGWNDFSEQDWRYTMIMQNHPKLWILSNLFGIMMMPTFIVFIQLIGGIAVLQQEASMNMISILGFVMIVAASMIQYVADKQMRDFKSRTAPFKLCIEEGLWKYSRHPNYFGEVSVWWGVYLIYVGTFGVLDLAILPPILMTALFLFISIPMMEKKILKSRPQYADYQNRVSMIIPFFPKPKVDEDVRQVLSE